MKKSLTALDEPWTTGNIGCTHHHTLIHMLYYVLLCPTILCDFRLCHYIHSDFLSASGWNIFYSVELSILMGTNFDHLKHLLVSFLGQSLPRIFFCPVQLKKLDGRLWGSALKRQIWEDPSWTDKSGSFLHGHITVTMQRGLFCFLWLFCFVGQHGYLSMAFLGDVKKWHKMMQSMHITGCLSH